MEIKKKKKVRCGFKLREQMKGKKKNTKIEQRGGTTKAL